MNEYRALMKMITGRDILIQNRSKKSLWVTGTVNPRKKQRILRLRMACTIAIAHHNTLRIITYCACSKSHDDYFETQCTRNTSGFSVRLRAAVVHTRTICAPILLGETPEPGSTCGPSELFSDHIKASVVKDGT
jgi:hypothetical protein